MTRTGSAVSAVGWRSGLLGFIVLLLALAVFETHMDGGTASAHEIFVATALMVLAGVVFLILVRALVRGRQGTPRVERFALTLVLATGFCLRLVFLLSPPIFEDDYHRYLWDGAVVANGLDPFTHAPLEAQGQLFDDGAPAPPALRSLAREGEAVVSRINHPHLRTIYPPGAQVFFALSHKLAPWSLLGWKALLFVCELATLGLLVLTLGAVGRSPLWCALYAWNPLVLLEISNSAHMDALLYPFVVASLFAALRGRSAIAGVALGAAAAIKLWPMLLFPPLWQYARRQARGAPFAIGFIATAVLTLLPMAPLLEGPRSGLLRYSNDWVANSALFPLLANALSSFDLDGDRIARLGVGVVVAGFALWQGRGIEAKPEALLTRCRNIVAVLFLLSPTQYPWYATWLVPFLVLAPSLPLLSLAALAPLYYLRFPLEESGQWALFENVVVWLEYAPVWLGLAALWLAGRLRMATPPTPSFAAIHHPQIAVVIPALNEEATVATTIERLPKGVARIVVVDNGSSDATASRARAAGAQVVHEPYRGYGAACVRGIEAAEGSDLIVFVDADGSDAPEELPLLTNPITEGRVPMVIGSRTLGRSERGALSVHQRLGNWLACAVIRLRFGSRYSDLGPFRAIRTDALRSLGLRDRDFGWTAEMQVAAALRGWPAFEVPVSYAKQPGPSKISGTIRGSFAAARGILGAVARATESEATRPEYSERT